MAEEIKKKRPQLSRSGIPVIWWIGTSTRHQKHSPIVQFEWCWQTSLEHGFYPIALLRVPGHSRSYIFYQDAARDLPAYAKLINLLRNNTTTKPKLLLTIARDRLGRNALATQVEALCDEAGCQIWSGRTGQPVEGNVGQIFASGMELTLSRAESYQTQERRRGAVLRRVKDKKLPYGKPEYGYKIVRDDHGKSVGVDKDPRTSPIRKLIDEWFVAGNSPSDIALRLQRRFEAGDQAFAPPQGKLWYSEVIRKLLKSRFPSGEYTADISGQHLTIQGNQPLLRTETQQAAIDRQFNMRKRGTQRGNLSPARYYGIAYCADCNAKMVRIHPTDSKVNHGIDYSCSAYRYSLRTTTKLCSTHYTYEKQITEAIISFFQQPVDENLLTLVAKSPKDKSNEIQGVQKRLDSIKQKKIDAIKLKLDYGIARDEFDLILRNVSMI
ncbi:MAG: recombinase zinc beta ribbon domain-containing protein [Anaerolineales bacterium]